MQLEPVMRLSANKITQFKMSVSQWYFRFFISGDLKICTELFNMLIKRKAVEPVSILCRDVTITLKA